MYLLPSPAAASTAPTAHATADSYTKARPSAGGAAHQRQKPDDASGMINGGMINGGMTKVGMINGA